MRVFQMFIFYLVSLTPTCTLYTHLKPRLKVFSVCVNFILNCQHVEKPVLTQLKLSRKRHGDNTKFKVTKSITQSVSFYKPALYGIYVNTLKANL